MLSRLRSGKPLTSQSSSTRKKSACTGESKRNSSSTAAGIRPGSSLTRALRRPHCESGSVFSRNAQHLGHDDHRQGPGDRLHEIERGWVVDVVQQGPQNAADAGLKRVDCSRGEGFADERPQPRVDLTTLPAGVFAGLTALTELYLFDNALSTLPAGVFAGLTALTILDLIDNGLDHAARRCVRRTDRADGAVSGCQRPVHAARRGVRRADRADGAVSVRQRSDHAARRGVRAADRADGAEPD